MVSSEKSIGAHFTRVRCPAGRMVEASRGRAAPDRRAPRRMIVGASLARSTTVVGSAGHGAGVDDERRARCRARSRIVVGVVQRLVVAGQDQRRRQDRLAQLREQRRDHRMRPARARRSCCALRCWSASRHFARRRQQERVTARERPAGRCGTASCPAARSGPSAARSRAARASGGARRRQPRMRADSRRPPRHRRDGSRAHSSNRSDRRSRRRRARIAPPGGSAAAAGAVGWTVKNWAMATCAGMVI